MQSRDKVTLFWGHVRVDLKSFWKFFFGTSNSFNSFTVQNKSIFFLYSVFLISILEIQLVMVEISPFFTSNILEAFYEFFD